MSTRYHFLPVLRQGLAASISTLPSSEADGENQKAKRADVELTLHVERRRTGASNGVATSQIRRSVQMHGPGDVTDFDDRMIVRTDPMPNTTNFEPNYFPAVDFADPDFPWRFSPEPVATGGSSKPANVEALTPWITLVVLSAQDRGDDVRKEFEELPGRTDRPAVKVFNPRCLPSLAYAWRWAHVQVTNGAEVLTQDDVANLAGAQAEALVSRLVCPRRLHPKVRYRAFVVPTYRQGWAAALGASAENADASAYALAWDADRDDEEFILPYYYSWEFQTSEQGDFEFLVRLLEGRDLSAYGLGKRDIDCERPGYGLSVDRRDPEGVKPDRRHLLEMEGALESLGTTYTCWGEDDPEGKAGERFRQELRAILDRSPEKSTDNAREPMLVPPLYGRWHAARQTFGASPGRGGWMDELNLDPRHRSAAGLGAEVVRRQQEALMASAWEQLGAIEAVNDVLRRAQFGREVSSPMHDRFRHLGLDQVLQVSSPVHGRVVRNDTAGRARVVRRELEDETRIPAAVFSPSFRRLARRRGPIRTRQGVRSKGTATMLSHLANRGLQPPGARSPEGTFGPCAITTRLLRRVSKQIPESPIGPIVPPTPVPPSEGTVASSGGDIGGWPDIELVDPLAGIRFCESRITCSTLQNEFYRLPDTNSANGTAASPGAWSSSDGTNGDAAEALRAVCEALDGFLKPEAKARTDPPKRDEAYLEDVRDRLLAAVSPEATILSRTRQRLRLAGPVATRWEDDASGDPLREILAAPTFPQPMYEPLRDISESLVLPGIDRIPQNTIGVLGTNRRFMEAYMVGLNHEFARELLWRGYPTDQRGSYFRQFWDVDEYVPSEHEEDPDAPDGLTRDARERLKDIKRLVEWTEGAGGPLAELGSNGSIGSGESDRLILVVRGDLLKRYPNAVVYAIDARKRNGQLEPALPEYVSDADDTGGVDPIFPVFRGSLGADLAFFGFPFSEERARGVRGRKDHSQGKFFVLEERISEARFGLDEGAVGEGAPSDVDGAGEVSAYDLSWKHFDTGEGEYLDSFDGSLEVDLGTGIETWSRESDSALRARMTWQKPVRFVIHADELLPSVKADEVE